MNQLSATLNLPYTMDTRTLAICTDAQSIPGHAQVCRVYIGRSGLDYAAPVLHINDSVHAVYRLSWLAATVVLSAQYATQAGMYCVAMITHFAHNNMLKCLGFEKLNRLQVRPDMDMEERNAHGRLLTTSARRIEIRDAKMWRRETERQMRTGIATSRCPCTLCLFGRPLLRTTQAKHVRDYGRHPMRRLQEEVSHEIGVGPGPIVRLFPLSIKSRRLQAVAPMKPLC